LPAIEHIKRSDFRFRIDQRRKLAKLLPSRLADLSVPPADRANLPGTVQTIADLAIQGTEDVINSYITTSDLISKDAMNPANVRAALSRLRAALKPFVAGWVDTETAGIIPVDLDEKLAAREEEIASLRLSPEQQRNLAFACQLIGIAVKRAISTSGEAGEYDILPFIDAALSFAHVTHPDLKKHRDRLAALVFPET
jgi:hypothetical protein